MFCNQHREKGIFLYKMKGMDGLKVKGYSKAKPSTSVKPKSKAVKPKKNTCFHVQYYKIVLNLGHEVTLQNCFDPRA